MSVSLVNESRLTQHWHAVAYYRTRDYIAYRDDDTPKLGGSTVYMGDLETCSRMDAEYVAVPVTAYGDYMGGSVQRSNLRSLARDYGQDTFIRHVGDFGSEELLLPMHDGEFIMPEDAESFDSPYERMLYLREILANLQEQYPLYDEEDESELVSDAAWEAWDQYLRHDTRRDLIDACESGEAMEDMLDEIESHYASQTADDDTLRQAYYRLTSELGNEYPYMENGSDSIYFPDHKLVLDALASELWSERCAMFAPPADQPTLI